MNNPNHQWLKATIAKGLAGLVVLRLPNQPPEEMITKTAEIWVKAILHQKIHNGWNAEQDQWRIEHAFLTLYAQCDRFPSPKMLLERLPARKILALPEQTYQMTDEERQLNQQFCQQMKAILRGVYVR